MAKTKKFRVYDNRDNKTLFEGSNMNCLQYIADNINEDSVEFNYVWLEEIDE